MASNKNPSLFDSEWDSYRAKSLTSISEIHELHDMISDIKDDTKHLRNLDSIANELRALNTSLVGPATGRKQISLVAHLTIVLILGTAFLVVLLDRSDRSVRISAQGLEILRGNQEQMLQKMDETKKTILDEVK